VRAVQARFARNVLFVNGCVVAVGRIGRATAMEKRERREFADRSRSDTDITSLVETTLRSATISVITIT